MNRPSWLCISACRHVFEVASTRIWNFRGSYDEVAAGLKQFCATAPEFQNPRLEGTKLVWRHAGLHDCAAKPCDGMLLTSNLIADLACLFSGDKCPYLIPKDVHLLATIITRWEARNSSASKDRQLRRLTNTGG